MRATGSLLLSGTLALLALAGCATALKRESQCLASLTPEVLQVHEEIANLEAFWHESLARRDAAFRSFTSDPSPSALPASQPRTVPVGLVSAALTESVPESKLQDDARRRAREAYETLAAARVRHQPILGLYDKIYQRVRTRTEEEEVLSNVRMVLLASPVSLIVYPIIRWNVHAVFWDGSDPDAEQDPVTRFCRDRVGQNGASADRAREPAAVSGPRLVAGAYEGAGAWQVRPDGAAVAERPRSRERLVPGL